VADLIETRHCEKRYVSHDSQVTRRLPHTLHVPGQCTLFDHLNLLNYTAFNTRYLKTMAPIDDAVAALRASNSQNIAATARAFGVKRSTLSKRFHSKSGSKHYADQERRFLTP
jgi:hypothetical protein